MREVLILAAPMMITTGAWAMMLFIDRLILFKSSVSEFNAALPAGTLYWLVMSLFVGIASYTNTFVAQYFGADKKERIGASVWQGIRLGIYSIPFFLILIPLGTLYFKYTTSDIAVAEAATNYFKILMLGCASSIIAAAQGALFNGQGKTRIVMLVNIGAVVLNIILDYVLILGKFGCPKMGILGAGIATTVSSWAMVIAFGILMKQKVWWQGCHLNSTWRHDSDLFGRMIRFGTPNGLPMLVEAITFHALVKIVLSFGVINAAASTMVLSINQLSHFPLVGLGIACSILVGQRIASQNFDEAKVAINSALILGLGYCAVFLVFYLFLPGLIIKPYREMMPWDGAFFGIRDIAVVLLRLAGLYLILECLQLVFSGAIKGAGDTWFVLKITIFTAVVTLIGYFLTLSIGGVMEKASLETDGTEKAKSMGVYSMWLVYILQIALLAAFCIHRFSKGKWKQFTVMEPDSSTAES